MSNDTTTQTDAEYLVVKHGLHGPHVASRHATFGEARAEADRRATENRINQAPGTAGSYHVATSLTDQGHAADSLHEGEVTLTEDEIRNAILRRAEAYDERQRANKARRTCPNCGRVGPSAGVCDHC